MFWVVGRRQTNADRTKKLPATTLICRGVVFAVIVDAVLNAVDNFLS